MRNAIAAFGGILAILAAVPYMIDILKGRTKPNVVSWFTWTLLLVVGTAAAFSAHQSQSALLTLGDTLGTGLTLLLGLKFGIAQFSVFDVVCQAGAIFGLILWLVFDSPAIAVIFVVLIDLLGSLPTVKHSWEKPSEETWETFALLVPATVLTIAALQEFTLVSLSYPLYLLIVNATVTGVVIFRRLKLGISLARTGTHESLHE